MLKRNIQKRDLTCVEIELSVMYLYQDPCIIYTCNITFTQAIDLFRISGRVNFSADHLGQAKVVVTGVILMLKRNQCNIQ